MPANVIIVVGTDTISDEFEKFWNEEQEKVLKDLVKVENLSEEKQKN